MVSIYWDLDSEPPPQQSAHTPVSENALPAQVSSLTRTRGICLGQSMASDIPMGEPDADVPPEAAGLDSKEEEPAAAPGATTVDQDPVPGQAATEDAAEGTNGVTAGDETVVDEVGLSL